MTLELHPPDPACDDAVERGFRVSSMRRRIAVSVGGAAAVAALLVYALAGRGSQFSAALRTAPLTLVGLSVLLQIGALLTRTEAWAICVRAAGGTVSRRVLFRSAAFGCVASIVNGSVGMAVRIASVRRAAPLTTPGAPALVAAEVPIITVELALVALFSFTLVAPLGVPLWVPAIIIMLMVGLVALLRRVSTGTGPGWGRARRPAHAEPWPPVHVRPAGGVRPGAAQLADAPRDRRARLDLRLDGATDRHVHRRPTADRPEHRPAATVLILGAHGVAATAAAGVLVTLTGIIGSLIFAAWAATDSIANRRRAVAHRR